MLNFKFSDMKLRQLHAAKSGVVDVDHNNEGLKWLVLSDIKETFDLLSLT